ncbi:MAG: hypothetical protein VB084_10615 [Syntrophomonadaceae bacterium]|nr:hypothetical protein [Syntrophomonadaceae bacterium]
MTNQIIVWAMLTVPWLTLFFMKKEDIRRFMPLALFTMLVTSIVFEAGITYKLWNTKVTTYPLNQTISYIYGMAPVVAMWVFKFTYGRFWLYAVADTVFNLGFGFIFTPWLASLGIKDLLTSRFNVFLIVTGLAVLLYIYQMWQENAWADRKITAYELQPARKRQPQEGKGEES